MKTKQGEEKSPPFWNAAPPEDSARSWERRREKEGERGERGGRGGSRGKTRRGKGSLVLIKQCAPPLQTCGGDGEQALKREGDNGRGGRRRKWCAATAGAPIHSTGRLLLLFLCRRDGKREKCSLCCLLARLRSQFNLGPMYKFNNA